MVHTANFSVDLESNSAADLQFQLPDPTDSRISDAEFQQQVLLAWQVCDRFDLQTDIWRGRILRAVRDREKRGGDENSVGFLNWLNEHEISKSQAYSLIELATSADALLNDGIIEPDDVNAFSKRAFVETVQAAPEVQQMIGDAVRRGESITRRDIRRMDDEWITMTSDAIPVEVKEKAANHTIPIRYVAPLVREMEKLPELHQAPLQEELSENPDVSTLKQVTAEARYLAKYLSAALDVQALNRTSLDIELALEEALRVGCLNSTADLVNQAAQLEQTVAKLHGHWKKLGSLAERVYLDSGASTPHLRSLLDAINPLTTPILEVQIGDADSSLARTIRLKVLPEENE